MYQRSTTSHTNRTIKAAADKVFTNVAPRKHPAEDFPTRQYVQDQERLIEQQIQRQREQRLQRDLANPPSKQQRKQRRSNPASENVKPLTPATTT